jgi:RNA polymerase sigma-70 factor (ECF subfamily)
MASPAIARFTGHEPGRRGWCVGAEAQARVRGEKRFEVVLAAAQAGEEWALVVLYRRLQPSLLAYLRSRRPGEGEDLASETWLAAARGLGRFRGDERDFRRWLFTIAHRRLQDHQRSVSRRPPTVPERAAPEVAFGTSPDAQTEALAAEASRRALERIAELPPSESEVVLLRVVAGLSAEDVGAITGRSAGAVRVLQHRALRRLATLLGETLVTLSGPVAM